MLLLLLPLPLLLLLLPLPLLLLLLLSISGVLWRRLPRQLALLSLQARLCSLWVEGI